jgi:ribosomal protein S18 acetylase RimI-like enzyme
MSMMRAVRATIGLVCLLFVTTSVDGNVIITRIQEHQVQDALTILYKTVFELQLIPSQTLDDVIQEINQDNGLFDMNDIAAIEEAYFNNRGIFLVAIKDGTVMGTGALKKIDDHIGEFRRIYFDAQYCNKGFGSQLMEQLFRYAHQFGYKKIRLCIFDAIKQAKAVSFYKKFGFYEIAPYKDCEAQVFMEKIL